MTDLLPWTEGRKHILSLVQDLIRLAPYTPDLASDWTPKLDGDCQTKSGWAKQTLRTMGIPDESMKFWACDTEDGKRHGVLIVTMDKKGPVELVLDCRQRTIMYRGMLDQYSQWTKAEA